MFDLNDRIRRILTNRNVDYDDNRDYSLIDHLDGKGPRISIWNSELLGTLPTEEELASTEPLSRRRLISKSTILDRLTDAQLTQALSLMSQRQRERWRMPGRPDIYVDDQELLAVLDAIGADPEVVLASQ